MLRPVQETSNISWHTYTPLQFGDHEFSVLKNQTFYTCSRNRSGFQTTTVIKQTRPQVWQPHSTHQTRNARTLLLHSSYFDTAPASAILNDPSTLGISTAAMLVLFKRYQKAHRHYDREKQLIPVDIRTRYNTTQLTHILYRLMLVQVTIMWHSWHLIPVDARTSYNNTVQLTDILYRLMLAPSYNNTAQPTDILYQLIVAQDSTLHSWLTSYTGWFSPTYNTAQLTFYTGWFSAQLQHGRAD